jgi:NAD(P)-dependent dehydrogenase (short-subunit alcohol dehydrogenase family)
MQIDFSNKKVLVVGSSKGIGKEAFLTFKSLGADVFGISRSEGIDISKKADIDKFFKKMSSIDFFNKCCWNQFLQKN